MSMERELLERWVDDRILEPEELDSLMKETKELLAQPEEEPSVKLPESEDEAVLMNLLSDNWLRNHAPHRLNQPEQDYIQYLLDQVARLTAENAMLKEKWLTKENEEDEDILEERGYNRSDWWGKE